MSGTVGHSRARDPQSLFRSPLPTGHWGQPPRLRPGRAGRQLSTLRAAPRAARHPGPRTHPMTA
eukprot:3955862-Alexandrium_andersonii.AAC.1